MNAQWYNENEARAYPLVEDAYAFPTDMIVDLSLTIDEAQTTNIHIPYLRLGAITSFGIASDQAGLFMFTRRTSELAAYTAYPLTGLADGANGWVVFGAGIFNNSDKRYRVDTPAASQIDGRAVHPIQALPVSSVLRLGDNVGSKLKGLVALQSGGGIVIRKHETAANVIVLELENPAGFLGPCNMPTDLDSSHVSVHSINGVRPNDQGVIVFRFTR